MKSAIDSSLLIALLYPDDTHNQRASQLLHKASKDGGLFIAPLVRSELAAISVFHEEGDLDRFFTSNGITTDHIPTHVYFKAGKAFEEYTSRRGEELQCPECGHETVFDCPNCDNTITARQHIPADFLIGAHAEHECDRLLSFDEGFYRDYFDVELLTLDE